MVSVNVNKQRLLMDVGEDGETVLEALPQIKAGLDKEEGENLVLEVTGDRPDLLSRQGVARALKGFLGKEKGLPAIEVKEGRLAVEVKDGVEKVRPCIVAAAVKGVTLDGDPVAELMQIQEKLVLTHGRRRKKVAIGVHDFDKIVFPLVYEAVKEKRFVPLNHSREMGLKQILAEHEKGVEYAFILEGKKDYPVISDAKGVISFPPIINSARTAVTEGTRNLFIEITGADFEACNTALNIMCQDFFDDGCRVYSAEIRGKGKKIVTPVTKPEKMVLIVKDANKALGLSLSSKELAACLERQRIGTKAGKDSIECFIPPYRADFLHEIDLVEEAAIGYGYNLFEPKPPSVFTKGGKSSYTLLADKYRDAAAGAGFVEASTHVLTSRERMEKAFAGKECVAIKNPVSSEYSALRCALMPCLLEVLSENTHSAYQQKIFEVGEVVVKDAKTETRTRTDLRLCLLSAHKNASLSEAASVLAKIMPGVALKETRRKQFTEGRAAEVLREGRKVGVVGEISPEVLERYGLQMPCAAFEVTLKEGER